MKKVYNYEQFIYIKGCMKDFIRISPWKCLYLLSSQEALDCTHKDYFNTFSEFFKAVQEDKVWNAEAYYTKFLKRPKVCIMCSLQRYYVTERNFKEACLQHRYTEAPYESMRSLIHNLTANELAEYLRENNLKLGIDN